MTLPYFLVIKYVISLISLLSCLVLIYFYQKNISYIRDLYIIIALFVLSISSFFKIDSISTQTRILGLIILVECMYELSKVSSKKFRLLSNILKAFCVPMYAFVVQVPTICQLIYFSIMFTVTYIFMFLNKTTVIHYICVPVTFLSYLMLLTTLNHERIYRLVYFSVIITLFILTFRKIYLSIKCLIISNKKYKELNKN